MTEDEKKVQFEIRERLMADIRRLREERDEWKRRYYDRVKAYDEQMGGY